MKSRSIGGFLQDDRGTSAIEYGLIAVLVSIVALGTLKGMGVSLITLFTSVNDSVQSAQDT